MFFVSPLTHAGIGIPPPSLAVPPPVPGELEPPVADEEPPVADEEPPVPAVLPPVWPEPEASPELLQLRPTKDTIRSAPKPTGTKLLCAIFVSCTQSVRPRERKCSARRGHSTRALIMREVDDSIMTVRTPDFVCFGNSIPVATSFEIARAWPRGSTCYGAVTLTSSNSAVTLDTASAMPPLAMHSLDKMGYVSIGVVDPLR